VAEYPTLPELHDEMMRIAAVLLIKNQQYVAREEELMEQYRHSPLQLRMRLDDDFALNHASGGAKTCAALVAGLGAAITAEVAYAEHLRRENLRRP
jgi:hypothetical protein